MRQIVWIEMMVRLARTRLAEERGQGTLEYVGMIAVAAVLIVGLLEAVGAVDLAGFFTEQVDQVKNGAS
jgi:hypothetical protein